MCVQEYEVAVLNQFEVLSTLVGPGVLWDLCEQETLKITKERLSVQGL